MSTMLLQIGVHQKGDYLYEARYRRISEFFICQYSSIILNNSRISKLFRYVNSCISMQFHGRLVRNWCVSFEVIYFRKWVHHDTKNIINSLQTCVIRKLQAVFSYSCFIKVLKDYPSGHQEPYSAHLGLCPLERQLHNRNRSPAASHSGSCSPAETDVP